jgi:hypothetical protein
MNSETLWPWQAWALLSAAFAALTAIFAKIGVEDINSDLATSIRTIVVLISLLLILFASGKFTTPGRHGRVVRRGISRRAAIAQRLARRRADLRRRRADCDKRIIRA